MKFYPHSINDYASATAHLSNEEDICYRRLLDRYYDTELPLENDPRLLARQCRVSQDAVRNVLDDFFKLVDGRWHNSRADEEITRWYDKCHNAKLAIESRWAKKIRHTDVLRTNGKRNTESFDLDTTQDLRPKTQEVNLNPLVDADATTPVDKSPRIPNCPHQKLIDIFHAEAISLPRVAVLNEARKVALARLWKQVLASEKDKTTERGLEYFEGYFNFIEQSDFLTGRAKNGKDWSANFDWIIKAPNFVKIIEGTYHRK
jgi:uncharacterized protein YdaU (DUF1376 family)